MTLIRTCARASTWFTVAAGCAALTAWIGTRPTTEVVTVERSGDLMVDYRATGEPDAGRDVTFGDTVFLADTESVDVHVTWTGDTSGDVDLVVHRDVTSSAGWHRSLAPPGRHRLTADDRTVVVELDLAAADRLATDLERRTRTSGSRTVTVVAELRRGDLAVGHVRLGFDLTATAALPAPVEGGAGPATTAEPRAQVRVEHADGEVHRPAPLVLGPLTTDHSTTRTALAVATVGTAAAAAVTAVRERRRRRRSPADDAHVRHGHQMVWVSSVSSGATTTIDVTDVDTLVRVARELDLPVTAERSDGSVIHRVFDGATVYRFVAPTSRP